MRANTPELAVELRISRLAALWQGGYQPLKTKMQAVQKYFFFNGSASNIAQQSMMQIGGTCTSGVHNYFAFCCMRQFLI
jgi:hypothetical protein